MTYRTIEERLTSLEKLTNALASGPVATAYAGHRMYECCEKLERRIARLEDLLEVKD